MPNAGAVSADDVGTVQLVDCGTNFEGVRCPSCAADLQERWQEAMDDGYQGGRFVALNVSTPCCGMATSVNDLDDPWPVGFTRFTIEVMSPDAGDEEADALAKVVAEILGTLLRVIWDHY